VREVSGIESRSSRRKATQALEREKGAGSLEASPGCCALHQWPVLVGDGGGSCSQDWRGEVLRVEFFFSWVGTTTHCLVTGIHYHTRTGGLWACPGLGGDVLNLICTLPGAVQLDSPQGYLQNCIVKPVPHIILYTTKPCCSPRFNSLFSHTASLSAFSSPFLFSGPRFESQKSPARYWYLNFGW